MNDAKLLITNIKTIKRIITPWKKGTPTTEQDRGWNDCVKEINRNFRNLLPILEKVVGKYDTN